MRADPLVKDFPRARIGAPINQTPLPPLPPFGENTGPPGPRPNKEYRRGRPPWGTGRLKNTGWGAPPGAPAD